jgi:hypothetical protein
MLTVVLLAISSFHRFEAIKHQSGLKTNAPTQSCLILFSELHPLKIYELHSVKLKLIYYFFLNNLMRF